MFLHYLNQIPESPRRNCRPNNNRLQKALIDFYKSEKKCAMVDFSPDEYKSSISLYTGLRKGANALDLPVNIRMVQGEIYLERTE